MIKVFLLSLFAAFQVFAHGEDTPGPHGGAIRMPSSFHTELVVEDDGTFRIYLLDIEFKNPSVKNSSVKVSYNKGKKKLSLGCMAMDDHFHCQNPDQLKKGNLIVTANREGVSGVDVKYPWPMKTKTGKQPAVNSGHSHHH